MSEMYSDHYVSESGLQKLSADVKNNWTVLQERKGSINIEPTVYVLLEQRLADQSFRDMLTLVKRAKDGLFRKELNMHFIGADGYQFDIAVRGKNINKETFDTVRSTDDGDMYLTYCYEAGNRKTTVVSKRNWYILYEKFLLVDRQVTSRSAYLVLLDGIYDTLLDCYLKHGTITPPSTCGQTSPECLGGRWVLLTRPSNLFGQPSDRSAG